MGCKPTQQVQFLVLPSRQADCCNLIADYVVNFIVLFRSRLS